MEEIVLLQSDKIDPCKWDACVEGAANKSVYVKYCYVDALSKKWYGLVIGDYLAVLPLPYKNYFLFKILYTPNFIQRFDLMVTAGFHIQPYLSGIRDKIHHFFRLIIFRSTFELWDTKIATTRVNFYLPLNKPYAELAAHYTKECTKNVRKASHRHLSIFFDAASITQIISLYRAAYGKLAHISSGQYKNLEKALSLSLHRKLGFSVHVEDEHQNCVYAAFFLLYGGRLSYIIGAPTREGRNSRATYFAIDNIIQHFAGQDYILDFEGSSIDNVAHFYKGFGPQKETFLDYFSNTLPFPFRQIVDYKLLLSKK